MRLFMCGVNVCAKHSEAVSTNLIQTKNNENNDRPGIHACSFPPCWIDNKWAQSDINKSYDRTHFILKTKTNKKVESELN